MGDGDFDLLCLISQLDAIMTLMLLTFLATGQE